MGRFQVSGSTVSAPRGIQPPQQVRKLRPEPQPDPISHVSPPGLPLLHLPSSHTPSAALLAKKSPLAAAPLLRQHGCSLVPAHEAWTPWSHGQSPAHPGCPPLRGPPPPVWWPDGPTALTSRLALLLSPAAMASSLCLSRLHNKLQNFQSPR